MIIWGVDKAFLLLTGTEPEPVGKKWGADPSGVNSIRDYIQLGNGAVGDIVRKWSF